jgi:hypothetical protein
MWMPLPPSAGAGAHKGQDSIGTQRFGPLDLDPEIRPRRLDIGEEPPDACGSHVRALDRCHGSSQLYFVSAASEIRVDIARVDRVNRSLHRSQVRC